MTVGSATSVPPQGQTSPPPDPQYVVQRGDTLWQIAKQHGVSLESLIAANPEIVNPDLIYPDQSIRIPGSEDQVGDDSNGAYGEPATPSVAPAAEGNYNGGPLSRVQLAQVFYQAGFRGENLVSMVAIAMRESGGRPDAFNGNAGTGDKSYGLVQINMIGKLGEARREQLGLTSNDQLFDPLTNAKAAYTISNNGTDLSPWGGYKGESNTYNTDVGAARAAVQQAEAQGLLGQSFASGSGGGSSGGSSGAVIGAGGNAGVGTTNAQTSMPTLRIGAQGPAVADLQRQLKAAGFSPGPIDGKFGPQTQAAVKKYQAAHGLVVDGWVGKQTWGSLQGGGGSGRPAPGGSPQPAPAGPVAPVPGVDDARIQSALDFGLSNIGAPYVGGASPFRFGTPGDGHTYKQSNQHAYVSPKGVTGFDCSGLVVAMYRKAGIDLAAQGIANTRTMQDKLPAISRDELKPGDLLVKGGSHVVIYLGDRDGDGRAEVLEATPNSHGETGVMVSDASKYLNNADYVCRRVPLG
jgi:spore coat assembly protein SafA